MASTSFSQLCHLPRFPLSPPKLRSQYFQHMSLGFIPLEPLFTLSYGWFLKTDLLALLHCLKPAQPSAGYRVSRMKPVVIIRLRAVSLKPPAPHTQCRHTPGHLITWEAPFWNLPAQFSAPLCIPSEALLSQLFHSPTRQGSPTGQRPFLSILNPWPLIRGRHIVNIR